MTAYSDDDALLEALKRGDVPAFEWIYRTYFDALWNYADRLLNDVETARDVVQQVFCKLWDKRRELEITLSMRAYLFKSVYNYSMNTLAHKRNVQKYEEQALTDFYYSTVMQTPEAEMNLWRSDVQKALHEAIGKLPERNREVLLLSKLEGLKNREIAEKLNISENTVERHITLALSRLREELNWLMQIVPVFSFFDWG